MYKGLIGRNLKQTNDHTTDIQKDEQAAKWLGKGELDSVDWLPADLEVVEKLLVLALADEGMKITLVVHFGCKGTLFSELASVCAFFFVPLSPLEKEKMVL